MSSGSRGEAGENQEFVQIGVLEAEFDKCRKQLFSQLRKAHGRIADLDKEVNKKTDIIVDLKREITEQKDNFAKNIASKEEKLRILSVEMNEKHKINNMLKKENDTLQENSKKIKGNKFSEESPKPENENQDSAKTSQYMINTNEVLLTEIDQLKLRMEYLVKDRDEKEKTIADFCEKDIHNLTLIFELQEKLETLKNKNEVLSNEASTSLTYNNPNIADLSDEKRPTKLAEEFSEDYDNEWTDAFDELNFETEREKTNFMFDILMITNAICSDLSNDHTKRIKDAFCRLTTSSHHTFANIVKRSRVEKKEVVPINLQMIETFESHNKRIGPNEEEDSQTDEEQTGSTAVEFELDFGLVAKEVFVYDYIIRLSNEGCFNALLS